MRPLAANLLTVAASCADATQRAGRIGEGDPDTRRQAEAVVGSYYRGDGLGFNLSLELGADWTFVCGWTGCVGSIAQCSGTWSLDGDRISINAGKVEGAFKKHPLGDLQVVADDRDTVLVQVNDREFHDKGGASRYSWFRRSP